MLSVLISFTVVPVICFLPITSICIAVLPMPGAHDFPLLKTIAIMLVSSILVDCIDMAD